jgi:hypothetical protein
MPALCTSVSYPRMERCCSTGACQLAQNRFKAVAPYRADLVVGVECLFTWDWLADFCAREGMPFALGHALYMKAIPGGKAKNDKIAAQQIAVLLRGGMLPQAYAYPAAMRATRDLLRRRRHLMRQRAELLAHLQHTNSQYSLPKIGKKIAHITNRDGVAERFPEPAVQPWPTLERWIAPHFGRPPFLPATRLGSSHAIACDQGTRDPMFRVRGV